MAGHPGQQRRPWQSHIDMYRKIPMDLMEGTRRGSILSYLSLILMIVLFIWETKAYFTTKLVTDLALDYKRDMANTMTTTAEDMGIGQASNYKDNIRLNFNITMTDLSCDYAVIDVVSVLGTDQNVTAHVTKWNIDGNGVRKGYKGRNRNQKDIDLFDINIKETLEELHEDGEDAVTLTPELFEEYKKNYDYVFVDFFASWCSHCKDLAPTWEALAEVMTESSINVVEGQQEEETKDNGGQEHNYSEEDFQHAVSVNIPVIIGKVDCVDHKFLCNQEEQIRAYPTLRLFIDGKTLPGGSDYKGHRTVMDMVDWLKHMEEQHKSAMLTVGDEGEPIRMLHTAHETAKEYMGVDLEEYKKKNENKNKNNNRLYNEWKESEHPGCQLSGHLLLDRVPGNFHILARSKHHDLSPHLTNVSHMVNSLSIGYPGIARAGAISLPEGVQSKLSPMDGNMYTTNNLHESYHHYLKVITTISPGVNLYQIIPSTQLSYYTNDMVPEAKFVYDLSPISVTYRTESRRWYEYITSLFAIIGGVFTMVGMIESSIHAAVSKQSKRRVAMSRGGGGGGGGMGGGRY